MTYTHSEFDPQQTFFLLDFDRTLANTDKLHDTLEQAITDTLGISTDFLRTARRKVEKAGESFDTIEYVRTYLAEAGADDRWLQVQQAFIRAAKKEDMLEPYAKELMQILDKKGLPYGIITYGGEAWQLAKIEATNLLHVPHLITRIKKKGDILAGWKQDDGTFIVPPLLSKEFRQRVVNTLVFLDDKPVSFLGIPKGVVGIHVWPITSSPVDQADIALEPSVRSVHGLREAAELLFPT
jgi:hypothetical protein